MIHDFEKAFDVVFVAAVELCISAWAAAITFEVRDEHTFPSLSATAVGLAAVFARTFAGQTSSSLGGVVRLAGPPLHRALLGAGIRPGWFLKLRTLVDGGAGGSIFSCSQWPAIS